MTAVMLISLFSPLLLLPLSVRYSDSLLTPKLTGLHMNPILMQETKAGWSWAEHRPQGIHRINLESPEPLFDHRADLLYSIWYFGRTFFPRIYTELSALLGITQGGGGGLDSGWVRLIVQCLLLNTFCILSEQLEYPKLHKLVNTDH